MHLSIEHFDGKFPSFNVSLHTDQKREPFLVIKGCRLIKGQKGDFISFPSKKMDNGKYWNHVYASEPFMAKIVEAVEASMPKRGTKPADDSDIPF